MNAPPTQILLTRAMREDRNRFARVRDSRVLIYWPHGLGDWAHLGAVAAMLEPSNTYAIVRFGDDYGSMMEGNRYLTPLQSGMRAPGTGAELGAAHLGLDLRRLRGGSATLRLPSPLDAQVRAFSPDVLLWTDYPETEGRTAYPFHTKARNLARLLVAPQRLASFDLSQALPNSIDFSAPPQTQQRLDERLASFAPPGTRVAVLSRAGVTAARKNWGDGTEARAFVEAMRRDDARWRFISMDEEQFGDGVAGFRALFGGLDEPFARAYKALLARTQLIVGVPAGPLHVAMARGGIPVVGLWIAHHPDWYDEPNPAAVHLVGRYVRDRRFERRVATTTKPPSLRHSMHYLETPDIAPAAVLEATRSVL
ncbi:MAG: hypothetical protein JOY69_05170 [Candidatus Eremiobacteraeota bacterium]|nr:hypothetical protein [Candidatus Eremiobacteraeota bacterium]